MSGILLTFASMKKRIKLTAYIILAAFCPSLAGIAIPGSYPETHPGKRMEAVVESPPVMDDAGKLLICETKATILFESASEVLHEEPYVCHSGKRIDNSQQISRIDGCLNDSTVDILDITICAYSSPDAPYASNLAIAKGRCKTLVEYISRRYKIPVNEICYFYTPENWDGFRAMTESSDEISEEQRNLLLDLIDTPALSSEDYDNKEVTLKADPRYAMLYYDKILPEWFPNLRTATVTIRSRARIGMPLDQ